MPKQRPRVELVAGPAQGAQAVLPAALKTPRPAAAEAEVAQEVQAVLQAAQAVLPAVLETPRPAAVAVEVARAEQAVLPAALVMLQSLAVATPRIPQAA